MYIFNKIIRTYADILKNKMVKKLKNENITDTKVVYFKNKDFQEEVLIDNNMNPHYTTTYFKAINIDANLFQPSILETNQRKIEEIDSKLVELKTKRMPFGFSIKISKAKNDNSS